MELRVGCAMWAHKAWQGRWLPAGLRREEQLPAYASWCTAVEGNTTFYATPAPATVEAWAREAPPAFRFLCKVPQAITHERRLRDAEGELRAFLDALAPLGPRAERVSVQLPGGFGPNDLAALDRFLALAPGRFAVEIRHPAFFEGAAGALERVLARHGAEWTTFDTTAFFATPPTSDAEREAWAAKPRLPRRAAAVGPDPVVRYLGRDDVETTAAGWQPWLPVVARWLEEGRTPTFFVHTPDNVDAPDLARRFHGDVHALVPALSPLPTPLDLAPPTLF